MAIQINLDEVVDPFAVAPDGSYTVECTHGEERESKAGDDMVELHLKITGGGADDIDDHIGKKIRDYMVISGENAKYGTWRLSQYAEAAGIDISDCTAEEFIGYSFDVEIGIEPPSPEFDAETNKIRRVYT